MASKQLKEDMIRAIKGTGRLIVPPAKERAAFRFDPVDPSGADVAQAVAEEEKNRRLLATRAAPVASSSVAAPRSTGPSATPLPEVNVDKLPPAEPMDRKYFSVKSLPSAPRAPQLLSEGQLQRYAAATNPGAEVEGTPDILARYKANLAKTTPAPTPTPTTMPRDLLDRRVAFAKELKDSARVGGYNPAEAAEQARSLNISPEDFARFAKRESLGELQAQQERQMIQPVGSDSALNLRRGLQTEAGRMRSVGRQVGRDIKRGMDPEFARQAGLLKMTTPGIRTQDQRIAEQQGQEKTAAAFQANENQYAKLMQDADTDPDLKRKLDRMLAKRAKKAA